MSELLTCPFCGYDAKTTKVAITRNEKRVETNIVMCIGCGAEGPLQDSRSVYDEQTAINLWNFRISRGLIRPKPEPRYDEAYFDFVKQLDEEG